MSSADSAGKPAGPIVDAEDNTVDNTADNTLAPLALTQRQFELDVEHGGIRLLLPVLAITAFGLTYVGVGTVVTPLAQELVGCVAFVGAVLMALATAFVADLTLKRVWKSGRSLILTPATLTVTDRRPARATRQLRLQERFNVTSWRFTVKRGSASAQRGWYLLGLQLVQDEQVISLYTFVSPKRAASLPELDQFSLLTPRKLVDQLPLREAHQQRRLLLAEDERWNNGYAMTEADFLDLWAMLAPYVAEWQAQA